MGSIIFSLSNLCSLSLSLCIDATISRINPLSTVIFSQIAWRFFFVIVLSSVLFQHSHFTLVFPFRWTFMRFNAPLITFICFFLAAHSQIVALSLYLECPINVHFTRSMYKLILSDDLVLADLEVLAQALCFTPFNMYYVMCLCMCLGCGSSAL